MVNNLRLGAAPAPFSRTARTVSPQTDVGCLTGRPGVCRPSPAVARWGGTAGLGVRPRRHLYRGPAAACRQRAGHDGLMLESWRTTLLASDPGWQRARQGARAALTVAGAF